MLLAAGGPIESCHLELSSSEAETLPVDGRAPLERVMIETALRLADGCLTRAARRIGWTRQKLYRRMRALSMGAQAGDRSAGSTSSDSSTFQ